MADHRFSARFACLDLRRLNMARLAGLFCVMQMILLLAFARPALATPTENQGIPILPAPGTVVIDGKDNDWDLTGGIYSCDDLESQRENFSVWLHAMYDSQNLYLLARWNDPTPLNNPGSSKGDYGFAGDCLQFRIITHPDKGPAEKVAHFTCWRDREGIDLMDVVFGHHFNEGKLPNAKTQGAQQAFFVHPDGKGYNQEIAIPWSLITTDGKAPEVGDRIRLTFEPNFTLGLNGRVSLKENFKAGIQPDRVFTFQGSACWGEGTLEAKGNIAPHAVRIATGEEFPVHMDGRNLVVDWNGLIKVKELPGFIPVAFTMPADGYVSLNLIAPDGTVARQLLNNQFMTQGKHEVKWDGLTTPNWRTPGQPVPAGDYKWSAIWHQDIGLRLRGWAANSGSEPWDNHPNGNWGGDHGTPSAAATDGDKVYLGWSGAEAGKALLAVNTNAQVQWHNTRGGIGSAVQIAADHGNVYVVNSIGTSMIYRVDSKTGIYTSWEGTDITDLSVKTIFPDATGSVVPTGMAARDGKLFVAYGPSDSIAVVDDKTGKVLQRISVTNPGSISITAKGQILALSDAKAVVVVDPAANSATTVVPDLANARGLATDADGKIYVGLGDPANQIVVYDPTGKEVSRIGKAGGRPVTGPWQADGVRYVHGLVVDNKAQLWVMEEDFFPKRVSVWDTHTGKLVKELFGPTTYGAIGGGINPRDPNLMVGQGCEWRIDPKTGRDTCLGVITHDGMENARFGEGTNGRLYLAVAPEWIHGSDTIRIFERLGDGNYVLRSQFFFKGKPNDKTMPPTTTYWADANGDGQQQPEECVTVPGNLLFSGWYMYFNQDMSIYQQMNQFKVSGFTSCGAPLYDLAHPIAMPALGLGSADAKLVLQQGAYNTAESWFKCFDIAGKNLLWTYPDNFVGVHGSHNATPPEVGMIRGSYGPCAAVKLPEPIGNAWVIATNVGEWHILTEKGFYLTRLFQPDPLRFVWPANPTPGAIMDNAPCGMGGEDFGGSAMFTPEGKLYLQSGKTGFWNLEVVGLETVKSLGEGKITVAAADLAKAAHFREEELQAVVGTQRLVVHQFTPTFTGKLDADFKAGQIVSYMKQSDAAAKSSVAFDATNLYIGWEVKDATPWGNSATEAPMMYIGGDTVDFQLATNPAANPARSKPVEGDLRLSIGNFQGKPTAVLYRAVSATKQPHSFSSGIFKDYVMDYVAVVPDLDIKVAVQPNRGYTVEVKIPLATLGLTPKPGVAFKADLGVTHGDPTNQRTRLRSYWSNQHTGITDDAVVELQPEPSLWGEFKFEN